MSDYVKNILIGVSMVLTVSALVRYGHDFSGAKATSAAIR